MINYKRTFRVSSFDNLTISLFVIGYKNIGESIIVLLRDSTDLGEKIIMSMVVDCYETVDLNVVREVLKKHSVSKLDFVCWTHPHCDHSMGIDRLINDFFHNDIVIFTPKFYYPNLTSDLLKGESMKADKIFNSIWNLVDKHKNVKEIWRTISANGDYSTNVYPMRIIPNDIAESKDLTFRFLTPLGYRTDCYATAGKQFNKPNELSISFLMSLDGYDFYFGGDTENEHANGIESEIIKNMRWIKVPHHCSRGAINIANNLGPRLDFAVSTVYTSSGLPAKEIQNIYAKEAPLHMTQLDEINDYQLNSEYGIVQYDYHFKKNEAIVDIFTYGNAGQYFPIESVKNDN